MRVLDTPIVKRCARGGVDLSWDEEWLHGRAPTKVQLDPTSTGLQVHISPTFDSFLVDNGFFDRLCSRSCSIRTFMDCSTHWIGPVGGLVSKLHTSVSRVA